MPLLHGVLPLHDPRCEGHTCDRHGCIRDSERFCRTVLDTEIRRRQIQRIEYDQALVYLVEEAWRLAEGYDPARGERRKISSYVRQYLPDRLTNWINTQRRRNPDRELYLEDLEDLHPERALTPGPDDPTNRLDADLARLLRPRSSDTAAAIDKLGKTTARRTRMGSRLPPS